MNSSLSGLIFDVDGVIADSEAVNASASIRVFRDLFGLTNVTRNDFRKGLGRGAAEYVRAAAREHQLELSDEQVEKASALRQEYFINELRDNPLPPFPGVMELINSALADTQWRIAIATSSTRNKSGAVLKSAGIPVERMEYICGDDVSRKKPDPELFQKAAARINLAPAQCVVIEDAPDGIQAALAAGCSCIAVTNSSPAAELADADLVVKSLTEVSLDKLKVILARHVPNVSPAS